jgi:CRP-like cAMP-binding protein
MQHKLVDFIITNTPHMQVSPQTAEDIVEHFEELSLAKNEFLLKEGKTSGYYFLANGYLRRFMYDTKGDEITTAFYGPGRTVFEPESFFTRVPSVENIQALTDCTGYFTTFEKLNGIFHSIPAFREFGRAMLVREFVIYKKQNTAMINKTAEERYAELLQNNKELLQHAQLKHIASFLGMTDTSLSRIRRAITNK